MVDKPFISWDAEGYDTPSGRHNLSLWGNSLGDLITDSGKGLSTAHCLYLLWSSHVHEGINVIFSGSYDVNMILGDLDFVSVDRLYTLGKVTWNGWRIEYRPRKWLKVTRDHKSVTLWDVFTYFGKSLVKTIEEYLGKDYPDLEMIKAGKDDRKDFAHKNLETDILPYWNAEHRALIAIMEKLRDYLYQIGIVTNRWHGPGSVASQLLTNRKIIEHMNLWPQPVYDAIRGAYFAGRAEAAKYGTYHGPVYRYDLRSAWPAGLVRVPSLAGKSWYDVPVTSNITDYDLVHVNWHNHSPAHILNALPHRSREAVSFPRHTSGWYWGVEVRAAMEYTDSTWTVHRIIRLPDRGERPLEFINEFYRTRAMWKKQGIQAQLALKLALNSLYGKFAQQLGGSVGSDGVPVIPKWHQLDWAGFATAHCRAKILKALALAGDSTIAVETDAVFCTKPLELDVGTGLGQWEESVFEGIVYLQTGLYFIKKAGEWKVKSRGIDLEPRNGVDDTDEPTEPFTLETTLEYLSRLNSPGVIADQRGKRVTTTRFRTMGSARGTEAWRTWETSTRFVTTGMTGKRIHDSHCPVCPVSMADGLHPTIPAKPSSRNSLPHAVVWCVDDYWHDEYWDEQDPLWSWED